MSEPTPKSAARGSAARGSAARGSAAGGSRASRAEGPSESAGDPVVSAIARAAFDRPILGQDRALATLIQPMTSGHFPHAWIFHGPRGVGKCTTALRVAGVLVDPLSGDAERSRCAPRGDTASGKSLRAGTHPDVRIIRAELASSSADRELRDRKQNNIPVALLREQMIGGVDSSGSRLDAPVYRSSVMGAWKVFIIDEAERLETDGQNVLLKTLEEPPPWTTIILVTNNLDRLLPTVRSRCRSLAFYPLSSELMRQWMDKNLGEVTGTARDFVQMYAAGAPGAAVTAVELGLQSWHVELLPMIDQLERGECPLSMAERMHGIASDVAEAAVKHNDNASKDAANRKATGLLFSVIGAEVTRRMRASAHMPAKLEYWSLVPDLIAEAERNLRANVNQKLALADFVAQWSRLKVALTGAQV
ncbi:MAG: AAA family ATPase [Phycisphaerales bacterium]|nr:AAA family ATPase [Phycisphaerales bacterium]